MADAVEERPGVEEQYSLLFCSVDENIKQESVFYVDEYDDYLHIPKVDGCC